MSVGSIRDVHILFHNVKHDLDRSLSLDFLLGLQEVILKYESVKVEAKDSV